MSSVLHSVESCCRIDFGNDFRMNIQLMTSKSSLPGKAFIEFDRMCFVLEKIFSIFSSVLNNVLAVLYKISIDVH